MDRTNTSRQTWKIPAGYDVHQVPPGGLGNKMRVITREKKRGLDTQIQQIINKRTKKYVEDADDPPQQTAAIFGSGRQLFQQKSIKSTKQSLRNVEIFIGMPRAGAPTFQIHFHEKKIKIKTSPPGGTRIQLIRFFFS